MLLIFLGIMEPVKFHDFGDGTWLEKILRFWMSCCQTTIVWGKHNAYGHSRRWYLIVSSNDVIVPVPKRHWKEIDETRPYLWHLRCIYAPSYSPVHWKHTSLTNSSSVHWKHTSIANSFVHLIYLHNHTLLLFILLARHFNEMKALLLLAYFFT